MIKSENGVTTIMGTRSMMATDLALIASSMRKALMEHGTTKEEAEEEILRYVKVGFMSDEERKKFAEKSGIFQKKILSRARFLKCSTTYPENSRRQQMEKKNSYFSYVPETLEEEYAFLAGRVAALEALMGTTDFMDKKEVAAVLGIKYEEREDEK